MLNRLPTPTECPSLGLLLSDLGSPSPRQLAKALDVSVATARRWIATNAAPRPVLLTLFWLTRWGMSRVDAESINLARIHAGRAMALEHEIRRLKRELARVVNLADFGSANDPIAVRFA